MSRASKNFWADLRRPILALAPMEGITDSAFRQICRTAGADVVYTEFVSADAIDRQSPTALAKLEFSPSEFPVVCQIFGREPTAFARAAQIIERLGFAGIDINFGCPARKVVSHGAGVSLMRNPRYARHLVESVLAVVTIPVSIKVRASIRRERPDIEPGCPDRYTALDVIAAIRDLPVAAMMIHGRTYEQGFTGDIDQEMTRQAKKEFTGIVLANGGIRSPQDATRTLQRTEADGVGIARGALGRPWIFSEIRSHIDGNSSPSAPWPDVLATIQKHLGLIGESRGRRGIIEFRKHLGWYVRGRSGATTIRRSLAAVETASDVSNLLTQIK